MSTNARAKMLLKRLERRFEVAKDKKEIDMSRLIPLKNWTDDALIIFLRDCHKFHTEKSALKNAPLPVKWPSSFRVTESDRESYTEALKALREYGYSHSISYYSKEEKMKEFDEVIDEVDECFRRTMKKKKKKPTKKEEDEEFVGLLETTSKELGDRAKKVSTTWQEDLAVLLAKMSKEIIDLETRIDKLEKNNDTQKKKRKEYSDAILDVFVKKVSKTTGP